MNKQNSYLNIQTTKESKQKELRKKNIRLINNKYFEDVKRNENIFKAIFTQTKSKKRKVTFLDNNNVPSLAKTNKKLEENNINNLHFEGKTEKDISMISFYDGSQKQINIKKNNSIAFIKKRPNDFIKDHNLNRSSIASRYSNSSFQKKDRCLSYTDVKNKQNILNNDTLSYFGGNITSTKKTLFEKVNPFSITDFSFKNKNSSLNRKSLCDLINILVKIMNKHLLSIKTLIFNNMKQKIKMKRYRVSLDEYKLLQDLKLLGVTNKKELNLFLKDIYFEINGKNQDD